MEQGVDNTRVFTSSDQIRLRVYDLDRQRHEPRDRVLDVGESTPAAYLHGAFMQYRGPAKVGALLETILSMSRAVEPHLYHFPGVGPAVAVSIAVLSRHVLVSVLEYHDGSFVHLDRKLLTLGMANNHVCDQFDEAFAALDARRCRTDREHAHLPQVLPMINTKDLGQAPSNEDQTHPRCENTHSELTLLSARKFQCKI